MQHYILQVLENIVLLQDIRKALATNAAYTIPVTTVFRKLLRQRAIYLSEISLQLFLKIRN